MLFLFFNNIITLCLSLQLQDAEASDQLQCFRLVTKPERGQTQAGAGRVRVCVGRRGAEDRRVPHQAEKEHAEERPLL